MLRHGETKEEREWRDKVGEGKLEEQEQKKERRGENDRPSRHSEITAMIVVMDCDWNGGKSSDRERERTKSRGWSRVGMP